MLAGRWLQPHSAWTERRSAIVECLQGNRSSRCRMIWAFAADRGSICSRWSRRGGYCSRWKLCARIGVQGSQSTVLFGSGVGPSSSVKVIPSVRPTSDSLATRAQALQPSNGQGTAAQTTQSPLPGSSLSRASFSAVATSSAAAYEPAPELPSVDSADDRAGTSLTGYDNRGAPPPADPDAILDSFAAAFSLPRHQLRMVFERQPGLQRANPELLAERITAYTRATGLSTYDLLYMVARRPAFLRLPPASLLERIDSLARGLALPTEDVLRLLVSQPGFLDVQPDTLRALSGRVAGELRVRPRAALQVLAGLRLADLRVVLSRPSGLLRERLAGLRRLLRETFGSRRATPAVTLLLMSRCPLLLALPTKAVEASLSALMSIPPTKGVIGPGGGGALASTAGGGAGVRSGGGSRKASPMLDTILACPHVLTLSPETLRSRFVALATAVRIDLPAVMSMLLLQPRLLLVEPGRVRQRLEGLTFALMVPRRAALDMVVRQPQLLLYNTDTLAEHWAALQGLLGVTFETALSIMTRHPNLLCFSPATLTAKLAALEATFAMPHARAVLLAVQWPALLAMSERRYKRVHRELTSLLGLPPTELGRLVLKEPYLLVEDSAKLAAKISDATSLLGVTEPDVGDMVNRSPHFITKEFRYWQTNLDTITSGLGVALERAREVAVRYPSLLAADPATLLRSASKNMALIRSSPAWLQRLETADCDSLFKCLWGYNDSTRQHLRFLVDSGLQSKQSFMSPIIWDRPAFLMRYPAFASWQRAQDAAATAAQGLPLRKRGPLWPPKSLTARASANDTGAGSALDAAVVTAQGLPEAADVAATFVIPATAAWRPSLGRGSSDGGDIAGPQQAEEQSGSEQAGPAQVQAQGRSGSLGAAAPQQQGSRSRGGLGSRSELGPSNAAAGLAPLFGGQAVCSRIGSSGSRATSGVLRAGQSSRRRQVVVFPSMSSTDEEDVQAPQ